MNPKISVVLPVYNANGYLSECIDSILKQTFGDFEFIIIDDGSTDDTIEIINSYSDKRIRIITNKNNQGITKSLNKGIFYAKGEYIARMDADDVSISNRLEKQLDYFNENEVDILGSAILFDGVDQKGFYPQSNDECKILLLVNSVFCHSSVMMKKDSLIKNHIFYDKNALYAEDYKLWTDASVCGLTLNNQKEHLLCYRLHNKQTSFLKRAEQSETAFSIRLIYANYYFKEILKDHQFEYLQLVMSGKPENVSAKEKINIEKIAKGLIAHNEKHYYFNKTYFKEFIESKLNHFL